MLDRKRRKDHWVYIPKFDLAIIAPPKCASRSLTYALATYFYGYMPYEAVSPKVYRGKKEYYRYLGNNELDDEWEKIAIIRDPLERFISVWAHHCRDGHPGLPYWLRGEQDIQMLVDTIRQMLFDNPHWAPQAYLIGLQKNIRYVTIEHAASVIRTATYDELLLPIKNETNDKESVFIPDKIKAVVKELYYQDYELMERYG